MSAEFPLQALPAPLNPEARVEVEAALRALLAWQIDLGRWALPARVPAATPIVSFYLDGRLVGCSGTTEGEPGVRLGRAFVQALGDPRFGGVPDAARGRLVAQVSYPHSPRRLNPASAAAELEVGTHGLALVAPNTRGSLLPDVAREHGLLPEEFLDALADKAGLPRDAWPDDGLFAFETTRVVVRQRAVTPPASDPIAAAALWLGARVRESGVDFGFDPATGEGSADPPMFHGRVAILVRALFAQSAARGAAVRAKRWLEDELRRGLRGDSRVALPSSLPLLAGTLALCALADIDCTAKLEELARAPELAAAPWYAGQVITALGSRAPESLYRAVVARLEDEPYAPWSLSAARARHDEPVVRRAAARLARCVRTSAPHRGGVGPVVPEIARTAATIEALAPVAVTPEEHSAVRLAREFVLAHQLTGDDVALALDPSAVSGAFPISPVASFLQIDVTAHALLALVQSMSFR